MEFSTGALAASHAGRSKTNPRLDTPTVFVTPMRPRPRMVTKSKILRIVCLMGVLSKITCELGGLVDTRILQMIAY